MSENGKGNRSVLARFGQGRTWKWGDIQLDVGEVIRSAGPGEGFAIIPWALDTYERALRLKPEDVWLLKRMLKHAWQADTVVFLSLHKLTREANVTRNRLKRILGRLEELGYIVRLEPVKGDQRRRYSLRGLYDALALCIAADPTSQWAKENGAFPFSHAESARSSDGALFTLDLSALPARNGRVAVVER